MPHVTDSTSSSLSDEISVEDSLETKSAELGLGSPKCKATVTASSMDDELEKKLSSLSTLSLSPCMALKLHEYSWSLWLRLAGLIPRRGRASFRGGEGGEDG